MRELKEMYWGLLLVVIVLFIAVVITFIFGLF